MVGKSSWSDELERRGVSRRDAEAFLSSATSAVAGAALDTLSLRDREPSMATAGPGRPSA